MQNIFDIIDDEYIKCKNNKLYVNMGKDNLVLYISNEGNLQNDAEYDLITKHFLRMIKYHGFENLNEENVFDFVAFVREYKDLTSYCTVCTTKLNINFDNKIRTCDDCDDIKIQLVTDDVITNLYKDDKIVFNMLILSAYACMKHPKKIDIFKPFPKFFKSFESMELGLTYNYENFKDLLTIVQSAKSDADLENKIGHFDYSFLKFIILTNITDIKSDILFSENNKNIFEQTEIENIFEQNETITFQVRHNKLIDEKFNSEMPQYLFHGSTLSNWYSILRNGIKNFSGTNMMIHGQAYGPGVYLSDDLGISYSYGSDKYCASKLFVVGVVQVMKEKKEYLKANGIYVVPDDSEIILRYIIVFKSGKNLKNITDYFMKERQLLVAKSSIDLIGIRMKRISYDISKINKRCKKLQFESEYETSLDKVVIKNKDNTVEICITYHKDYPSMAPFVWLKKSCRQFNNIVDMVLLKKGGFMIKKIVDVNWKSNIEIDKIVKKLIENFNNEIIIDENINNEMEAYEEYIIECKKIIF